MSDVFDLKDLEDDIADAIGMGDTEFDLYVRNSCVSGDEDDWDVLLAEPLVRRTKSALGRLRTGLNGVPPRKMTVEQRAFIEEITARTAQARQAIKNYHHEQQAAEREQKLVILTELAVAVEDHRLACIAAGLEAEPHDLALWDNLDNLSLVYASTGEKNTLGELVRDGRWYRRDK